MRILDDVLMLEAPLYQIMSRMFHSNNSLDLYVNADSITCEPREDYFNVKKVFSKRNKSHSAPNTLGHAIYRGEYERNADGFPTTLNIKTFTEFVQYPSNNPLADNIDQPNQSQLDTYIGKHTIDIDTYFLDIANEWGEKITLYNYAQGKQIFNIHSHMEDVREALIYYWIEFYNRFQNFIPDSPIAIDSTHESINSSMRCDT